MWGGWAKGTVRTLLLPARAGGLWLLKYCLINSSWSGSIHLATWFCSVINLIRPNLITGMRLYSDMAGLFAPNGGTIPPHILVTQLKPDIFFFNEASGEAVVFELTWPVNIYYQPHIHILTSSSTPSHSTTPHSHP